MLRKRGNPSLLVLITFPSRFFDGNCTSCFRHVSVSRFPLLFVSVTFLQTDFQFVCYNKNNFSFTVLTQISTAPNKRRFFGVIKFQSNANSKRKRKFPSRSCYIVFRLLIYVIVFQQNKETERLLLTKTAFFWKIKKIQISAASTNDETRNGSLNLFDTTEKKN